MTLSFLVTKRELVLGAADTVTGWYAKSYTETVDYDKMVIVPKGTSLAQFGIGSYAKYATTGITCAPYSEGDEVLTNGRYYNVATVEPVTLGNSHMWYVCELHEMEMHGDQPATYGTSATVEDPRHRTKDFLDTYILPANLTEDNGTTLASFIVCWADPDYPMTKLFVNKSLDVIFTVSEPKSEPILQYDKTPSGFTEHMPVKVFTIDKTTITGVNLQWKATQELRRIVTAQPYGSLRTVGNQQPQTKLLGSTTLYSTEFIMDYRRGLT